VLMMPLRWYADRFLARVMAHELRTQFGKRCDSLDIEEMTEGEHAETHRRPGYGRCGICQANEAADLMESMYR
jgi:hypothetical protein